jgi:pimeloyl-ACP methyl ester carboxylesterase
VPFDDRLGLYFTDQGEGPPVVLVHGFGLTHDVWAEQLPLAEEFRLIAYDTRGCGDSVAPVTGYGSSDLGDELAGLLDHLGVTRAHLVGHSRGGAVIMDMALRRPERVASLVFVSSGLGGFPYSEGFLDSMMQCQRLARTRGVDAAVDAWLAAPVSEWTARRYPEAFARVEAMTRRYSGADWLDEADYSVPEPTDMERLAEVQAPTFVLSGQEDLHDFVEIANMLTWWIPGAQQKSLLGAGHFPMLENPYETNLYLRAFLRKVAREKVT